MLFKSVSFLLNIGILTHEVKLLTFSIPIIDAYVFKSIVILRLIRFLLFIQIFTSSWNYFFDQNDFSRVNIKILISVRPRFGLQQVRWKSVLTTLLRSIRTFVSFSLLFMLYHFFVILIIFVNFFLNFARAVLRILDVKPFQKLFAHRFRF